MIPEILTPFVKSDSTVICIASGPSVNQDQIDIIGKAKEKREDIVVLGINDNWQWKYKDSFISDHCYAADDTWWAKYHTKINDAGFNGEKWIPIKADAAKKFGIKMIPCKQGGFSGISKNQHIYCMHHSGAQAIGIAYFLGAKKIILIGYDMGVGKDGKIHWFGNHPKGLRNTPNKYATWIHHYERLNKDLKDLEIDFVNCSINTAINSVRRGDLETELIL